MSSDRVNRAIATTVVALAEARGTYTSAAGYRAELRRIAREAWHLAPEYDVPVGEREQLEIQWQELQQKMRTDINAGYNGAMQTALRSLGKNDAWMPDYQLPWNDGGAAIAAMVVTDQNSVPQLFDWFRDHSQARGGSLSSLLSRMESWALRWKEAHSLALLHGAVLLKKGRLVQWIRGNTKIPCSDCLRYEGKIYPAAEWLAVGAVPQSRSLACRGYRCQCRLIPSKGPASSGSPSPPMHAGFMGRF